MLTGPCSRPSPALTALLTAVTEVRDQVPADLPGPVALADARVLMGQLDVLRAVLLSRLVDVESRQLHALDDASTTSAWVQAQPSAVDAGEVALARRLQALPHLNEHVTAGSLSIRAAQAVGVALDKVTRHVDRPDGRIDGQPGEPVVVNVVVEGVLQLLCEGVGGLVDDDPALRELVDELVAIAAAPLGQKARLERAFTLLARRMPPTMLRAGLDRLVDALLPQQLEQRERDGSLARALKLQRKHDGSGYRIAQGELSLECGEYLAAVLAALRVTDPQNPEDTAAFRALRDALGNGTPATPDSSTLDSVNRLRGGTDEAATYDRVEVGSSAYADDDKDADDDTDADDASDADRASGADRAASAGVDGASGDGVLLDEPQVACESAPEPRSRVQQDHDAFMLALRAVLDSGVLGTRSKTAPHVVVTVPAEALEDRPGALPAVSAATGARLPAGLVRRLLCDSRITRAVLGLGRRVLEISHTERTAKPHERLALHLRWGGRCAESGCTSPPGTPLIPHHGEPWAATRTTALEDQVPLCGLSHHDLHDGRIITLRDGRRLGPHGWLPARVAHPGRPDQPAA